MARKGSQGAGGDSTPGTPAEPGRGGKGPKPGQGQRTVPIGTPASREELERLKRGSERPDAPEEEPSEDSGH